MPFLREIQLRRDEVPDFGVYPFTVPAVKTFSPAKQVSPGLKRQLALLRLMADYLAQGCQFIMATHSPILLAYPGALVYWLDEEDGLREVDYQETEHFQVTRNFLNDPQRMLDLLLRDD